MIEDKKNNIYKNILDKNSIKKYNLIFKKLSKFNITLKKTNLTQIFKFRYKKIKNHFSKNGFLSSINLNQARDIRYQNLVKNQKFKILNKLRKNKFLTIIKHLKLNQINSDNFIFYLYLLFGILLSLTIFSLFTTRIITENKRLEVDIESSLQKKSKIPEITLKLKKLRVLGKSILMDNEFILNIIGAQKEPTTLLYIVNKIANKNNIDIVELEPLKKIYFKEKANIEIKNNSTSIGPPSSELGPPPSPVTNNQTISPNSQLSINSESNYLLTRKLERQIFNLKFRGYFEDSMQFIKDLELLENIVIFENLKLKRLQDYDKNSKSKILFESSLSVFGSSIYNELSNN